MITDSALAIQVGGDHYKSMPIQPVEFAMLNGLNTCQANIVKYVCRYRKKGGAADLEKALHYCNIWLQVGETYQLPWLESDCSWRRDAGYSHTIEVDTFIEANNLVPRVGKIVDLVCIAPDPERLASAKVLIMDLLTEIRRAL